MEYDWSAVKALFDEAADLPVEARAEFLRSRCQGTIYEEVASLLEVSDRAGAFLERSAVDSIQTPEGRIGSYRIVREIARGGSSVVYLGERADGHFQKHVAVKILSCAFLDGEPRRLFERERQLLAELDHPNIVRLWDGGVTSDGRPYLVEDYLDGPTITGYARQNGLSLRERLDLFLPVCDAVSFAHGKGIIHRDLKPGNILTTAGGVAKLVDFGIARFHSASPAVGRATVPMWTPAYGSPEQARGETAGEVSDIYSLGMVLAELLMDRPAIEVDGLDRVQAAEAVCHQAPSLGALPPGLAAVIGRALAKRPEHRYRTVADFRASLEQWMLHGDRLTHRVKRYARPVIWAGGLAAAAGMLLFLATAGRQLQPDLLSVPVTADAETEGPPSLSPDGQRVVYVVRDSPRRGIWMKNLATGDVTRVGPILGPDAHPSWSPDGSSVIYAAVDREGLELRLVRPGDTPSRLLKLPGSHYFGMDAQWTGWTSDGLSVLYVDRAKPAGPWAVHRLASSETREQLSNPPQGWVGDLQHAASPDGKWIALSRFHTGTEADVYLMPAGGGEARRLTHDAVFLSGTAWTPDSREIIYAARRAGPVWVLWRLPVDGASPPQRIAGTEPDASWPSVVAGPSGGMRIAYHHQRDRVSIRRWDDPQSPHSAPRWVAPSTRSDGTPQYSPDGRWIAFASSRSGFREIWVCGEDGRNPRQLTFRNGGFTDAPRWSPDGRQIAFSAVEGDNRDIYVVDAATAKPRRMTTEPTNEGRPSFSSDGRWLYFRSDRSGSEQIWRMPAAGGEWRQVTQGGAWEAIESLDGRWLYFARNRPLLGIWRTPPGGGAEEKVLDGVREGLWGVSHDGISFIVTREAGLRHARFGDRRAEPLAKIPVPFGGIHAGFSVRADGRSFLFPQTAEFASDVMMLDGVPLR